jgi:hypothetical protein
MSFSCYSAEAEFSAIALAKADGLNMKTPLNSRVLKHHLTYDWWKYLLALLVGIFVTNLILTVTAPRTPAEKEVSFYIYGYADTSLLTPYMDKVREDEMPDMESMFPNLVIMDNTYGPMQLVTYVAAQEGDLYLLSRNDFLSLASSGAFAPLEEDKELMALFTDAGIDLRRGWRTLSDSDETHLYGIPQDLLPGLESMCYADNGYLAVLAGGGNVENTLKFLRILCQDTMTAPAAPQPTAEP